MQEQLTPLSACTEPDPMIAQRLERAEEALRQREEQLAAFIGQSAAGFGQVDLTGKFTFVNDRFCEISGRTRPELLGLRMQDITHPDDLPGNISLFERARSGGAPFVYEKRYLRPDGTVVWVSNSVSLMRSRSGEPYGLVAVSIDVTERKRAEQSRRDSEQHLRLAIDAGRMAVWEVDLVQQTVNASRELNRLLHFPDDARPTLKEIRARYYPGERERLAKLAREAAARGDHFAETELRCLLPSGEIRWFLLRAEFTVGETGLPEKVTGVLLDITDRKRAEEQLRESEARQRAITEATPECIKIVGPNGELLHMNQAGLCMIEAPEFGTVRGADTFSLIAPEHLDMWRKNHARVLAGERLSWEFDIIGLEGTRRRMETHAVPLELPDRTVAQLAVTRDISDRKRSEEHQRLLINELNHRVKNTLAIVQGIAQQSFKGEAAAPGAREAFEGRLAALSAAHNVLTQQNWESASVRDIVQDAVAPYRSDRFQIMGPEIRLPPKTSVSLALALHELSTNALKYGALSAPEGQVHIAWSSIDGRLNLIWRETGGPEVVEPRRRGFGTRMIERGLAAEFGGKVSIQFLPEGVVCSVDAPLSGGLEGSPAPAELQEPAEAA
jgi:PAS domain S-box-containing protein